MLEVMNTYFKFKNSDTKGHLQKPETSLWYKKEFYHAFREWKLHTWRLHGDPTTWTKQLEDQYSRQPVFALISGLSSKPWKTIHDFCESKGLPSLFPNTYLPVLDPKNQYSLYLSKGLKGEAQTLATYLSEKLNNQSALQFYSGSLNSKAMAKAFSDEAIGRFAVETKYLKNQKQGDLFLTIEDIKPGALVLWVDSTELHKVMVALQGMTHLPNIYMSYQLIGEKFPEQPTRLASKSFFTYPYSLPDNPIPRTYRIKAWMRSRGVQVTDEKLQLNTYFALSVVDYSLMHIIHHFSRDYLIEKIEHETENGLSPGIYPTLSLAPGQRFASKRCNIVQVTTEGLITIK